MILRAGVVAARLGVVVFGGPEKLPSFTLVCYHVTGQRDQGLPHRV